MSSLSISTTTDSSVASTSASTTSRSTTSSSGTTVATSRSYTSPSRRSPTTSLRSARTGICIRNGSISHKSNLEEEIGTNKSGIIVGLMAFSKSSKKQFYAILSDRCFELHDNQKAHLKKKSARHIFDLATCFNINRHEDAKLKSCISIMTPDDTFIFRAADEEGKSRDANDRATMDWYDSMLIALVNARALHLGRPVLTAEFFEFCWDVTLVSKPKIRKPVPNPENFENICLLRPELKTRHRLGFYAHTIVLTKMGVQPAMSGLPKSGIPPFRTESFIEIQRQYVASFGFQEKYFIMRVGRAASTGMCEIWAQCESEEVAASIHTRLNEIIEREGKKRKSQSSSTHYHYQPSSSSSSTAGATKEPPTSSRSEPSHSPKIEHLTPEPTIYQSPPSLPPKTTMSLTSSLARPRLTDKTYNIPEDEALSTHSTITPGGYLRPLGAKSIDQAILRDITRHEEKDTEGQPPRSLTVGSQSPSSSSWLSMLRRRDHHIPNPRTAGTPTSTTQKHIDRFSPTITVSHQQPRKASKQSSFYPVIEWAKQRSSVMSGGSQPDDETEDSGGTLKVVDYEDQIIERPSVYMNGCLPHEKLIELALEGRLQYDYLGSRGSTSSYMDDDEEAAQEEEEKKKKEETKEPDTESIRKRQITNDSGKGEDSDSDRYNRFTPEEQEDSSSITADDAYSDDLSDRNPNYEACSTSSMGGASSHTSGHHEKESNSSGSVSHLLVPSTTEQQHLEDIQSYISDSSDSCYSSLNANAYAQNPPRAFSFSSNLIQNTSNYEMMHPSKFATRIDEHKVFSGTEESLPLSNEGLQLGEEAATSATMPKAVVRIAGANISQTPKEDLRKRAFSLGSRSWILNPLRKLSTNHARASSSKASSIADESENECSESVASHQTHRSHPESAAAKAAVPQPPAAAAGAKMLSPNGRADSIDSHPGRVTRYTKNTRKSSDLVEVNFSPPNSLIQQYNAIGSAAKNGSSNSVDSNQQRSRAPSFINNRTTPITTPEAPELEPLPAGPPEMHMSEVQCFIKKDDEMMLYALMKDKDTTSLYSTKTEPSMPYFETIEENVSSPSSPRSTSRHSRKSLEPIRKESVARLQPPQPAEELNYVIIGAQPERLPERKISVPSSRTWKEQGTRYSLSQSRSDNLRSAAASSSSSSAASESITKPK